MKKNNKEIHVVGDRVLIVPDMEKIAPMLASICRNGA
jgi:hypothetical protein